MLLYLATFVTFFGTVGTPQGRDVVSRKMKDLAAYIPTEGELIYHYCSPSTLLAILQSKSLRLGDIRQMNDTMERMWGLDALAKVLKNRPDLDGTPFKTILEQAIERTRSESMCLAICFSTDGDVLSQWRAYAENGAGYAIGFDPIALQGLPVSMLEVCYKPQVQVDRIEAGIDSLMVLHDDIGRVAASGRGVKFNQGPSASSGIYTPEVLQQIEDLRNAAWFLVSDLVAFKSPAFSEESEVRMVHHVKVDRSSGRIDLAPTPYPDPWPDSRKPQLNFVMRGSAPICYADLPIPVSAVKEIVLGPKAVVDDDAVHRMLATLGYSGVLTSRSLASYR